MRRYQLGDLLVVCSSAHHVLFIHNLPRHTISDHQDCVRLLQPDWNPAGVRVSLRHHIAELLDSKEACRTGCSFTMETTQQSIDHKLVSILCHVLPHVRQHVLLIRINPFLLEPEIKLTSMQILFFYFLFFILIFQHSTHKITSK